MTPPPASSTPAIAFVLVEPQFEGNIGACARALKNCGFRDLRLVRPPHLGDEALRMACGSHDLLHAAQRFDTLHDAIADARWVAAFTARDRRDLRVEQLLDSATPALVDLSTEGTIALLFGREDRGLTSDELEPANQLIRIPAAEDRLVYNLSQAVLLAAYQLRQAIDASPVRSSATQALLRDELNRPDETRPLMTAGARRHLSSRLRQLLVGLEYDQHPDPGLMERIVHRVNRWMDRGGFDESDQAMLLGVLRRIEQRSGIASRDDRGSPDES